MKGTDVRYIPDATHPEGGYWKSFGQMTEAEKTASHIPAASSPKNIPGNIAKPPASSGFVSLKVLGKIVNAGFTGLSLNEFNTDTQQGNWLGAAGSGERVRIWSVSDDRELFQRWLLVWVDCR